MREMQNKSTLKFYFIPVRMAKTKKVNKQKEKENTSNTGVGVGKVKYLTHC